MKRLIIARIALGLEFAADLMALLFVIFMPAHPIIWAIAFFMVSSIAKFFRE